MLFKKGQLVAVMGGAGTDQIRRIARVVFDDGGPIVLVETDSRIEGEAAVEYDFPTPEPAALEVDRMRLRPIVEDQ
jgi:hypothetical protein